MVGHRLAFLDKYSVATKVAGFGGACVLIVAIALHILAMSTPYYFTLSNSAAKEVIKPNSRITSNPELENATFGIRYGLWAICVGPINQTVLEQCYQITANSTSPESNPIEPDWLVAPRVLSIVGLLVAASGVVSIIAFALTMLDKLPQLFLATAAGAAIVGGILILSSDIAFAAEKTLAFYAERPMEANFFGTDVASIEAQALRIQQYDNRFTSGWSFVIDLISGVLCIVAGPCFVFVAWRLQLALDIRKQQPTDSNVHLYHGRSAETKL